MTAKPQSLKEELFNMVWATMLDCGLPAPLLSKKYADAITQNILSAIELRLPEGRPLNQQISHPRDEHGDLMHASGYNQAISDFKQILRGGD